MSNADSVRTFDRFAVEYDRKYRDFRPYTETYEKLGSFLSKADSLSVLEVACGPAHVSRYLISKGFRLNVFGFDLAPNMIGLARKNIPDGVFKVADCRYFDKFDRKFDVVVCGFCFPYLNPSECVKLVQDIRSVLKPGGISYISAIEGSHYYSELDTSLSNTMHTHYHTVDFLRDLFANTGFEILHVIHKDGPKGASNEAKEVFFFTKLVDIRTG